MEKRKEDKIVKRLFLRTLSLLCCIALCTGVLISCAQDAQTNVTDEPNTNTMDSEVKDEEAEISLAGLCSISASNQKATDDAQIDVSYRIPDKAIAAFDRFEVRVYHDDAHNNLLCTTVIDPAQTTAYVDTSYGKLRLELVGVNTEKSSFAVLATAKTSVWADEYNFASLNATFPVVYFTLELFSMDGDSHDNFKAANDAGKNIQFIKNVPTFVSLERTAAYNWNKLPENVHPLPNTTYEQSIRGGFHVKNKIMESYIKELHEVNPDSKFNFYCVDNYPELILRFFTAQGIDEDHFTATMISDGTASVSAFKYLYENDNAEEIYNEVKGYWETIKAKAAAGDSSYLKDVPYAPNNTGYSVLWRYALTVANEEDNVQWWCSRDNFTANTSSEWMKNLLAEINNEKIQYFGINDMLQNLSQKDQIHLKNLFHFDGEMFKASEEAGKKSLVLLGTNWELESNIEGYIKLLQAEYGDEYVIYYKGHPRYPTGLNAEKLEIFERYGISDIDASIAAELILFYCPDIYLAGYPSTTYKSALEGKFIAMFDQTKEAGTQITVTDGYGDVPDHFYTTVEAGGQKFVQIENYADETVRYFNLTTGEFVDTLPS